MRSCIFYIDLLIKLNSPLLLRVCVGTYIDFIVFLVIFKIQTVVESSFCFYLTFVNGKISFVRLGPTWFDSITIKL